MQLFPMNSQEADLFLKVITMRANIKLLDLLAFFSLHIEPLSCIVIIFHNIKARMNLNFGLIQPLTTELVALEHMKNIVSPCFSFIYIQIR